MVWAEVSHVQGYEPLSLDMATPAEQATARIAGLGQKATVLHRGISNCKSIRSCTTWRICRRAIDHDMPGVAGCRAFCKLSDWCMSERICNNTVEAS